MKIKPTFLVKVTWLIILFLGFSQEGFAASKTIKNDVFWKDTSGNPIYSQGGGILKVGSTYYWYGVKYNGAVTYAANPISKNSDTSFNAVTVYSSTDLATWTYQGNILQAGATGSFLAPSIWLGRIGVVYNSNTHKYVLVTQYSNATTGVNGVLFATSSSPTGTYTVDHVQPQITNVVTPATGDQTTFVDGDGTAYLVFSNSSGRSHMYVAPLRSSDYLNVEAATQIYNSTAGGREGNAMFKYNSVYYSCSSDLHGWNSSHTYCISATNIYGPYSSEFVMNGTDADFSHVSQTGFFVAVNGTQGTTILNAGDRWSDFAGNGIGYNQWTPLSFSGTTPTMNSVSEFTLDAATGTWAVGAGNNYILNPSFEADRVAQTSLAGWTTWTSVSGTTPFGNVSGGHTGRFGMQLWSASAYNASMYQNLNIPNGTYTLKAWVKSSGGQKTAQVYVKNFGNSEIDSVITAAIPNWTQITLSNIVVTNGKIEVGIWSDAYANNWVNMDDLTLIKN